MTRNVRGFTLIEVLIASVIIITVLSLTSMSFSNARSSSEKAANTLKMLAPVPIILDTVREQIRSQVQSDNISGDGILDGIHYRWSAELEVAGAPPANFDVEQGIAVTYKARYKLYQVSLTVESGRLSETYQFKELAWLPRVEEVE